MPRRLVRAPGGVQIWLVAAMVLVLSGCLDAEETMSTRPDLPACPEGGEISIPAASEEADEALQCLLSNHVASEAIELKFNLFEDGTEYQGILQTLDEGTVNYFREYANGGWGFHVRCESFQLPDGGIPLVDDCETEYIPAGN